MKAVEPAWHSRTLTGVESGALALSLAALTILPLTEIVLRRLHTGISGASSFIQHLTLVSGMIGAAVAARENRLLTLSTGLPFLRGRLRSAAAIFSASFAAAISVLLCIAGIQFVQLEREAGNVIAYGIHAG
jgi:TRAP-type C4-dicarboxylate transport system permease small subunit